jgi:dynein heavy chain
MLYIGGFDNDSLTSILEVFVQWLAIKVENGNEFLKLKDILITNTISLFEKV